VTHLSTSAILISLAVQLLWMTGAAAQVKTPPAKPASGTNQGSTPTTGAPAPIVNASPNYVVGPNDRLRITVWNQEDVSGEYVVSADGSFTFPLIGRVVAAGLTLAKLEGELKQLLTAGYFKNPQITAAVLEYRSKRIFIMGSVRQPGAVPLTGETSLIEALAHAGSTTPDAADHVFILHSQGAEGPVLPGQDASASVKRVDLRELNAGQLPASVVLQDGDTVYVPPKLNVYVSGQVRTPGAYPIGQETTVRQVLSLAGGPSEFGAVNRVKILRIENGKEKEIKVELNDLVKPGDTVVVPERFF
jgi:polysaccharide biosynthesis/export protein